MLGNNAFPLFEGRDDTSSETENQFLDLKLRPISAC
jgi:hypothetical protein